MLISDRIVASREIVPRRLLGRRVLLRVPRPLRVSYEAATPTGSLFYPPDWVNCSPQISSDADSADSGAEVSGQIPPRIASRPAAPHLTGSIAAPECPIEAALSGFTTQTRPEIQFDVDQVVRLDFALKPGTPNRIRGTPAAAALLGSETATVGHTLTVSTASNPGGRTASERGFITGGAHSYPMKRSG